MANLKTPKSRLAVLNTIKPYALTNRRLLAYGCILALGVVAIRVALPWPLKIILHQWVDSPTDSAASPPNLSWLGDSNQTIISASIFLVLLILLGWLDYWERLFFARFSINVAHDLRLDAVDAAVRTSANQFDKVATGDLISRLIGDLARFKAGLKGFLVHVATNGAYFVAVMLVLIFVDLKMGIVMTTAGIIIAGGTWWGAQATYDRAKRYRKKEGRLAETIQRATGGRTGSSDFAQGSRKSGAHEAALTQIQGRTTWFSHSIFGVAVVTCLIIGANAVQAGTLEPSTIVIFVLYALMLRAPIVQLSRQGARTGKILACLVRINDIVKAGAVSDSQSQSPIAETLRLHDTLTLNHVIVRAKGVPKKLLGPLTLNLNAGQRILILGERAAGKTCLLQTIRGTMQPTQGTITFDHQDLADIPLTDRLDALATLPDTVHWTRQKLGNVVDPQQQNPPDVVFNLITRLGGKQIIRRLKRGLSTKVASRQLSFNERKIILLTRLLLIGPSVLLLDHPTAGMSRFHEQKVLRTIFRNQAGRTIILTSTQPRLISKFDRIIQLRRGRLVFDGTPAEWKSRTANAHTEIQDTTNTTEPTHQTQ